MLYISIGMLSSISQAHLLFNSYITVDSLTASIVVVALALVVFLIALYSDAVTTSKSALNNE